MEAACRRPTKAGQDCEMSNGRSDALSSAGRPPGVAVSHRKMKDTCLRANTRCRNRLFLNGEDSACACHERRRLVPQAFCVT